MKVGIFTDTYFPQISGVSTSVKTLKGELEQLGHEVIIFTTTDPHAIDDEPDIVRLPSIPFISFKDRRMVIRGLIHAYEVAKDYQLELVHTQTEFGVGLLGKFVARKLNIPIIHTYHTMYEDYLHYIAKGIIVRPQHVRIMTRKFCHHLDGVVCPSQRVENKLHEYDINLPMRIIPTGIDLKQFSSNSLDCVSFRQQLGIAEDKTILLSLSRLSYEKNIQAIIHGMPEIVAANKTNHLVVAGDGPYREELEQLVDELQLDDAVSFVGEVDNSMVNQYYQLADYFVSLSTSESQGLTYIEALAAKTPIIAKENDYLKRLVTNEAMGLLLPNEESFAKCFIDYQAKEVNHAPKYFEEQLNVISSTTFGKRVETFYQEIVRLDQSSKLTQDVEEGVAFKPKQLVNKTLKIIRRTKRF
ncbi:glycosyltransferase family 4 protein [Vagococcus zengguangii]|uniref:Glycosyltransferase family 4 protein n=1 Tax=Vagococcus zengguangii TaxID=2571750 RepID=A0A4D7CPI0_9ENTE|nr:glycosyltransferase family 4 protein [Vagococcus zengguangii]QCI85969.1 glycosyltransferase family 4 protein [Vagococcus zengguangii]TLG80286.1 glycosyltransferase family 4 protein [Vagococcus zengguangii]